MGATNVYWQSSIHLAVILFVCRREDSKVQATVYSAGYWVSFFGWREKSAARHNLHGVGLAVTEVIRCKFTHSK